MRNSHKAGVTLLAGLAGLALVGTSFAETPPAGNPQPNPNEPQGQGMESESPGVQAPRTKPDQKQKGLGAGVGGQGQQGAQGQQQGAQGQQGAQAQGACGEKGFSLGPLDTGAMSPEKGYGAGIGQGAESGEKGEQAQKAAALVPQYWIADASMFIANAGNAAQTLANEQSLGVQSPSVLGNQAQFLLAAVDRAVSSLQALQANAESTNPKAVSEIRAAVDQLSAAKGQAQQTLEAANAGTLGPNHQGTIRSAYDHLQAAERHLGTIGREYGAQGFTLAQGCVFRPGQRGLGAGIGGKGAGQKAQPKGQEKGTPEKPAPEKGAQPPEAQPQPPPAPEK